MWVLGAPVWLSFQKWADLLLTTLAQKTKRGRGRPRGGATAAAPAPKRGRGRPRKNLWISILLYYAFLDSWKNKRSNSYFTMFLFAPKIPYLNMKILNMIMHLNNISQLFSTFLTSSWSLVPMSCFFLLTCIQILHIYHATSITVLRLTVLM